MEYERKDLSIGWELVQNTKDELLPLYQDHAKTIFGKEDVDLSYILVLEQNNMVAQLVARYKGEAVGYYGVCLVPRPTNPSQIEAKEVGIYTKPEFRGLGISSELTAIMEDECRKAGAKTINSAYPSESSIPDRLGWKIKEYVYEKVL